MKTQVQYIHFDANKKLKDFIIKKAEKLYKTFNEIESCDIILKLDKNDQDKNKIVEINLNIPNNRFFAKDQSESFEIAFDKAIDQIKKQLVKHKEKVYEKY